MMPDIIGVPWLKEQTENSAYIVIQISYYFAAAVTGVFMSLYIICRLFITVEAFRTLGYLKP